MCANEKKKNLTRRHIQEYTRSEHDTQLAKMAFDEIIDLTAGVYFNFYNIEKKKQGEPTQI